MKADVNGHNVYRALSSYPHVEQSGEHIAASIQKALDENTIPWLRIEDIGLAHTAVSLLSATGERQVVGYVLEDTNDVDSLTQDVLEPLAGTQRYTTIAVDTSYDETLKRIADAGIERVKRVWSDGEYSVIGEIMTVWPVGFPSPVRIEFEDDAVVRLGELDPLTWKVCSELSELVFPAEVRAGGRPDETADGAGGDSSKQHEDGIFTTIAAGASYGNPVRVVVAATGIVPSHARQMVRVIEWDIRPARWDEQHVRSRMDEGWSAMLVTDEHSDTIEELREGLPGMQFLHGNLERGFESSSMKLMCLSGRELWSTVRLSKDTGRGTYGDLILNQIRPGEYIVHEDHGIGLYGGLEVQEKDGYELQYLVLKYAQKDRLLVPMSQMKKLTKYVGAGTKVPTLTRLGGGEWRRVKARVTKAVKELAGELLRLYAVREVTKVKPLDDQLIEISDFEKGFPFPETEDQLRAIEDVKEDLRSTKPMDRVIVGDVGFGKTEVAMRAAYMVARSGAQIAVLAPTTVLVEQHYRVFSDRFAPHGIRVEALSRFLTVPQAQKVVEDIKAGSVDIVIGTHRLLSSDVDFKQLGLLVVDEEQKFGVSQKEKLKRMRVETRVLSLSATPIPRTLNMALSGVRDISVIATPPEGRLPIENTVERFTWKRVEEAIRTEVSRGGQVYYVHNRVRTIHSVAEKLSQLLPDVRTGIGHGQQDPATLGKVMREFNEGRYDVLLCTTIIENGLDMPNVNTLIIDRAEMFGLSQLYQIRGRIGRGDRQAHAYFLYHGGMGRETVRKAVLERERKFSGSSIDEADAAVEEAGGGFGQSQSFEGAGVLWNAARRRLDAIDQLRELGSGFTLAQRDLEIRGAGNFLGREQHGNVSAVGFSLYCRLLDEMISKLRKTL